MSGLPTGEQWSRRAMVGAAIAAATAPLAVNVVAAQDKSATAPAAATRGKLTDQTLGAMLKAMGLDAKANEQRYDFAFKATIEESEWELSMSAVLSQDGSSIWIMAWLDELPKSALDVPRTALLRLLSDNDKLGKGKFFAYIAANRRFVLQRVIPNENITAASFRAALDDLGQSVVQTHSHWSVSNWASTSGEDPAAQAKSGTQVKGSTPQGEATQTAAQSPASTAKQGTSGAVPAKLPQSAVNDAKFNSNIRK